MSKTLLTNNEGEGSTQQAQLIRQWHESSLIWPPCLNDTHPTDQQSCIAMKAVDPADRKIKWPTSGHNCRIEMSRTVHPRHKRFQSNGQKRELRWANAKFILQIFGRFPRTTLHFKPFCNAITISYIPFSHFHSKCFHQTVSINIF